MSEKSPNKFQTVLHATLNFLYLTLQDCAQILQNVRFTRYKVSYNQQALKGPNTFQKVFVMGSQVSETVQAIFKTIANATQPNLNFL